MRRKKRNANEKYLPYVGEILFLINFTIYSNLKFNKGDRLQCFFKIPYRACFFLLFVTPYKRECWNC